ncbi:MAG: A/G-specific adenine glycosylase [Clostridia bacterium]|nr:A/G-specific adenine glycosylase [Clostridia bacterium]
MKKIPSEIVPLLLDWYKKSKRDLPWRKTSDPYCIWLSEIMLQQTRVEAVKPYYKRFLEACPNVDALAKIPEEGLFKLWEGLGYYSRARNLQKAAKIIQSEYGGVFPNEYETLRRLPGIGDYTAGAVSSIAFGERVPAVDGNVLRVVARLTGTDADIALPETKKAFRKELLPLIPKEAGDFNQSLIELGATVCLPNGEPNCNACPLAPLCRAYQEEKTGEIPKRSKKKPRRIEERTVLIIEDGERTALGKRPDKGLLAGLFELPNAEGHLNENELLAFVRSLGFEPLQWKRLDDAKHIFTHVEWRMIAYSVRVSPEFDEAHGDGRYFLVDNEILHRDYAIPSAFSAYTKYL